MIMPMDPQAKVLDGKKIAEEIVLKIKEEIKLLRSRKPMLNVIQVGEDPASCSYIKQKEKMSKNAGIDFEHIKLQSNISELDLLSIIKEINNNKGIDGLLVQLPLPKHISPSNIIANILPNKDVDGFHPINIGNLFYKNYELAPCTPLGIMKILEYANVNLKGKKVTIIGASNIVGKPLSIMLINANATVKICHKFSDDIESTLAKSDIVISATGNTKAVNPNFIKPGAIVIDVGINQTKDGQIIGDLDAEVVKKISSLYTPVPGGVGPMTVAALMINTMKAYKLNMCAK